MKTLALVISILLLLSGVASAKKYDRVPDLDQLVKNPINGTYFLACETNVSAARDAGFEEIRVQGGAITLTGFNKLILVLMFNPGRPWDKIASNILIDLCIESETDYIIVSKKLVQITRVVEYPPGQVRGGPRSAIPQKTRPK